MVLFNDRFNDITEHREIDRAAGYRRSSCRKKGKRKKKENDALSRFPDRNGPSFSAFVLS